MCHRCIAMPGVLVSTWDMETVPLVVFGGIGRAGSATCCAADHAHTRLAEDSWFNKGMMQLTSSSLTLH